VRGIEPIALAPGGVDVAAAPNGAGLDATDGDDQVLDDETADDPGVEFDGGGGVGRGVARSADVQRQAHGDAAAAVGANGGHGISFASAD
jgi:hypothetical protein